MILTGWLGSNAGWRFFLFLEFAHFHVPIPRSKDGPLPAIPLHSNGLRRTYDARKTRHRRSASGRLPRHPLSVQNLSHSV